MNDRYSREIRLSSKCIIVLASYSLESMPLLPANSPTRRKCVWLTTFPKRRPASTPNAHTIQEKDLHAIHIFTNFIDTETLPDDFKAGWRIPPYVYDGEYCCNRSIDYRNQRIRYRNLSPSVEEPERSKWSSRRTLRLAQRPLRRRHRLRRFVQPTRRMEVLPLRQEEPPLLRLMEELQPLLLLPLLQPLQPPLLMLHEQQWLNPPPFRTSIQFTYHKCG